MPRRRRRWLRSIRAYPRKLAFFRCGIALAGLLFVLLGLVTGPFPGPGGIPLILIGVAIWSSEFRWARRVLLWLKAVVARFRSWSRRRQVGSTLLGLTCCALVIYLAMVIVGMPSWLPGPVERTLTWLPGL